MNIPQNFEKIDGVKFDLHGNGYRIEADHMDKGDVWVYEETGRLHPLCFDIDWQNGRYDLIKCPPGQGRNGTTLATNVVLVKHLMRDMDLFIFFIKDIVNALIINKII
jgi:hypothetical protein